MSTKSKKITLITSALLCSRGLIGIKKARFRSRGNGKTLKKPEEYSISMRPTFCIVSQFLYLNLN